MQVRLFVTDYYRISHEAGQDVGIGDDFATILPQIIPALASISDEHPLVA
jgi:hypothetical protein